MSFPIYIIVLLLVCIFLSLKFLCLLHSIPSDFKICLLELLYHKDCITTRQSWLFSFYLVINNKQDKTKLENITVIFYSITYYHPFFCYTTVAVQFGKILTQKDVLKMSIADRSKYLCQNPITGVRMFQHRLEAFFSEYLLSDTHPLGHITDYVIKIVFQMRGSPHAHCLL